ncbi:MAG: hypothetical protein V8S19_10365 [Gemmiger qucibialis]
MLAARGSIHIDHAILGSGGLRRSPYQQHFARPILHEQDLQHEELLAGYPERWGNLARDICLSE